MMSHRAYMLVFCLLHCLMFQGVQAQNWVDQKGQPIQKQQSNLTLNPETESPVVLAGMNDKNSFWINCAAGKKLPKSNYLVQKYKLDMPVDLTKQAFELTVSDFKIAGDAFKRTVLMFNSNEKTACGIALNTPTTGDLVRLDTRGQYKIRKKVKFKLPLTIQFSRVGDQVEINLNEKKVSDKLNFPYEADAKQGGVFSLECQLLRVTGNAMAMSLTQEFVKPNIKKKTKDQPLSIKTNVDAQAVHRLKKVTLPTKKALAGSRFQITTSDQQTLEIQINRYVTLRSKIDGQSKALYKAPATKVIDATTQSVSIQLRQLGPYCFVKLQDTLLGMLLCNAREIQVLTDTKQVVVSDWQVIALTDRHVKKPDQKIPKVAIQNVLGWLPPDTFTPSLLHGDHDFPVTPPVDNVRRDVRLMHEKGWNVAAVDFTFFSNQRVQRQYHMLRDWLKATAQEKLDDFSVIPFLEVATFSKAALKYDGHGNRKKIEVGPEFTALAMTYLMEEYANHPNWLKFKGRPVFAAYRVNHNTPAFWQQTRKHLKEYGWDPFIIGDLGSLQTALHGTFDYDAWRPYGQVMDGIFSFSASLLEVSLDLPPKFRECFATLKNPPIIGATVRPGYLSARPHNKNWISHRGDEIVLKSWGKALKYKPAFIHATTWNDYNEATQFSNSFSLSTSQLEIGQYYLNQFFDKPALKGKVNEPYAVLSYFKVSHGNEPVNFRVLSLPTTQGAKSGQWQLILLDQNDKKIASTTSKILDLTKPNKWQWQWDGRITKAQTRIVKVRLQFISKQANKVYHHIPDIAMIDGNMYGDELYYLVPLHKLAGEDKAVAIEVNHINQQAVIHHEGIVDLNIKLKGAAKNKTHVSVAANSYQLRLAADLTQEGAWREPSYGYHGAKIKSGNLDESSRFTDVVQDDWPKGNAYYCAQAQFEDGTVAWSPTRFVVPAYDDEDLSAQWVFTPRYKQDHAEIIDRTSHKKTLEAAPGNGPTKYVRLPGKFDVMQLTGHQRYYTALDALPNGPCSLEMVFRPDAVNRQQILCIQRGAQATLFIDTNGYLIARRLPQVRKYPDPYVDIRSKQPLKAGKLYQAMVVFDGSTFKLYLNGKLESKAACFGRRSTEMFVVGGPALPRSVITDKISPTLKQVVREIDGVYETSFYKGLLVRMTLFSRALNTDEVYGSFARLQSANFWQD